MYQDRHELIHQALSALNQHGVRATYKALGSLISIPARFVSSHLPCTQFAAVIVRDDTGRPGCGGAHLPGRFSSSPIIRTGSQLRDLIDGVWNPQDHATSRERASRSGLPADILAALGLDIADV
jgi:hypothetical protein